MSRPCNFRRLSCFMVWGPSVFELSIDGGRICDTLLPGRGAQRCPFRVALLCRIVVGADFIFSNRLDKETTKDWFWNSLSFLLSLSSHFQSGSALVQIEGVGKRLYISDSGDFFLTWCNIYYSPFTFRSHSINLGTVWKMLELNCFGIKGQTNTFFFLHKVLLIIVFNHQKKGVWFMIKGPRSRKVIALLWHSRYHFYLKKKKHYYH